MRVLVEMVQESVAAAGLGNEATQKLDSYLTVCQLGAWAHAPFYHSEAQAVASLTLLNQS